MSEYVSGMQDIDGDDGDAVRPSSMRENDAGSSNFKLHDPFKRFHGFLVDGQGIDPCIDLAYSLFFD